MRVEEAPAQVRVRVHRVEFALRLRDVLLMDEQITELELRGDVVGQLAERVVDREAALLVQRVDRYARILNQRDVAVEPHRAVRPGERADGPDE